MMLGTRYLARREMTSVKSPLTARMNARAPTNISGNHESFSSEPYRFCDTEGFSQQFAAVFIEREARQPLAQAGETGVIRCDRPSNYARAEWIARRRETHCTSDLPGSSTKR